MTNKQFRDMTEPEIRQLLNGIGRMLKGALPPGEMFVLVTFGSPGNQGIGQYLANAERDGVIKSLREFIDRLEEKEDVPR